MTTLAANPPVTDDARRTIDVSIVIVNWNTRDLLRDCLRSVFAGLGSLRAEVIVVDNASHDDSAAMVANEFPAATLIPNDDNVGFAAANNQGFAVAGGDYLLLLNPDTVVIDDVLERTLEYAETHPHAGVVGCQVMRSATEVQQTCFRFPSIAGITLYATGLSGRFPKSRLAGRASYGSWTRDSEREVDVVSGMYMLVRRAAFEAVGPMDESYFVYAEETDWCRRLRDAGWPCVFAPIGRILHVDGGGKSTEQVSVKMYVQLHKSLLRYLRKHDGPLVATLARLVLAAGMTARLAVWIVLRRAHRTQQAAAAVRFILTGITPTS